MLVPTPIVGLHRNVHLNGEYLLWPVFSYCGIVAFNMLCHWLDAALVRLGAARWRPVSFAGRHSMTLLVSHALVYMPIIHYSTRSPLATFCLIETAYLVLLAPCLFFAFCRSTS